MIRAKSSLTDPLVDMTALVDIVFNLLIFFLVATTFQQSEREMKIGLPEASAAGPISAALREIVINVDAEGGIMLGGKSVTPEELRATVEAAVTGNREQKIAVRADRRAAYASVVRVLDICKAAGVQQPYLDTIPLR